MSRQRQCGPAVWRREFYVKAIIDPQREEAIAVLGSSNAGLVAGLSLSGDEVIDLTDRVGVKV